MNKEQVKGTIDKVAGTVKRKTGEWTSNAPLEIKGIVQELKGEMEVAAGDALEDFNEAKVEIGLHMKSALDPAASDATRQTRS
jgi:uncharacterized protein YjbJ (UPF0337 family)